MKKKLSEILNGCLFTDGDWIESKDQDPNGEVRLIQLADIGDGNFIDKSTRFINRGTALKLKCTFLKKGDVLIARMPDPLGRACVFPLDEENKYVTAVDVCIIRPKENCLAKYLMYTLNSKEIRNTIERQKTGTTRERITRKKLGELQIPLPPLDQQKKIASILDAADAYRQKTKALIKKYDELTQSLFLDMFGDPVKNEKGWEKVCFTEVLVLKRGYDLPVQDRVSGQHPIMASNGILDWHNEFKVKGPGIITGRSGTLGQVHITYEDYWPLNTALYSQNLKGNNPHYILYLLKNFKVERFARGAGVPTLNRNLVHDELIINIPITLQNQFAERVQVIEQQKAKAQESLEKAEELFDSLLQKAFNGELVEP
jgi:type I restriction enzyme S subunit